jgi:hypothetical protein
MVLTNMLFTIFFKNFATPDFIDLHQLTATLFLQENMKMSDQLAQFSIAQTALPIHCPQINIILVAVIPWKIEFLELIWLYLVCDIVTAVRMKNIKRNINIGIFFFERVCFIFEGGNGSQKRVICHQLNRALVCLWNVTESFESPFKIVS